MEQAATIQLALIGEVTTTLSAANLPHWLAGGWAVDFFVGAMTRPHHDIEFVVWSHDMPHIGRLLEQQAYVPIFAREDLAGWRKCGQLVEFEPIERDEHGRIVTPGRWRDWPWPARAFVAPPGHLGDLVCPIVSGDVQLETKEEFSRHPAGGPPRPRDLADIEQLRRRLASGESAP